MSVQPHLKIESGRGRESLAFALRSSGDPTGVAISVPSELVDAIGHWLAQHMSVPVFADGGSPWLTVVEAARRAGYECPNNRAPATIYSLAKQIGRKVGNKWLIHVADFDQAIREGRA
jgi:hypothetical protein